MRLLIVTQAVDLDDSVLGFFHRWIVEFAERCEHVHVICLREGRHALPSNVRVHSLGKESGHSRARYLFRFLKYVCALQGEYNSVFVHMNAEYVLLGGFLWRTWGKRVVLWRNHKKPGIVVDIAAHMVHVVCYTSREAYVARFRNAAIMPVGVDMDGFAPSGDSPEPDTTLFLGRLDEVKRPDLFLGAMKILAREYPRARADVYGDPTPGREGYAAALKTKYAGLSNVAFHPGVPHDKTPALYRSHAAYVNLTPAGSFDKTIIEAAACGALVVAANPVLRGTVPEEMIVKGETPRSVSEAIRFALERPETERARIARSARAMVDREHSLALLAEKLFRILRP